MFMFNSLIVFLLYYKNHYIKYNKLYILYIVTNYNRRYNNILRFLSQKLKTNLFINYFGLTKVPLIFYCRPKVVDISSESVTLKIPLLRRNKNHVGSMYIGVLAVGADLSSAILALNLIKKSKTKIIPIFKDLKADFLKRAEGDVHFVCSEGKKIDSMIKEVINKKTRVNKLINVVAYVPDKLGDDPVAKFSLTLSIKAQ